MAGDHHRKDDELIAQVLAAVNHMADTQNHHIQETNKYRDRNDRLIESHADALRKNADATMCLKTSFEEYRDANAPFFAELADKKKFWNGVKDKVQEKVATALIVTGIGAAGTTAWIGIKTIFKIGS